ncbi:MAG: hypothetical protein U9Q15_04785 [Patescibacteria group bacterium]|nr:hypothetical protein [Patescibacteria group bacterium]
MSFPKKLFQYWSTIPQHIFPVSPTIAKHYSLPTNKLLPNSLDLSLFHSRKEITEIQNICMVGRIDHWK